MAHPLSRTDVRLGLAALALVGVIGAVAFLLGGSEAIRPLGRSLNIAVVAPVEPEVLPGETMEVGALNDGFDRAALERVADPTLDETYMPGPAWIGDEGLGDPTPRMPMPTPVAEQTAIQAYLQVTDRAGIERAPVDPLADGSRAFGFDTPRPDYAAERTRRLNRLNAATAQSATPSPANAEAGPVQYSSE